jgi:hypothetical protein
VSTPVFDISLKGTNIDDYINNLDITLDENSPFNSFSITLSDDFFLTDIAGELFNSTTNYIPSTPQVVIYTGTGDTANVLQGSFYIEDVGRTIDRLGNLPSNVISGRSETAILDSPFAGKLHLDIQALWGEFNMNASTIITNLLTLYGLELYSFDIDDFEISYLWTLEDYPISIISRIVKTTNGYIRSTKDGKIWIKKKTFHSWTADETFTDLNIINEKYELPDLINRVKYISPTTEAEANIRLSLSSNVSSIYTQDNPDTDNDDRVANLECVVTDNEGNGVSNGTVVSWDIEEVELDERTYPIGTFTYDTTITNERKVINEEQTASDRQHVSVEYPISSIFDITSIDGNIEYDVESFEGRRITFLSLLPFSNTRVLVTYKALGIATNTLTINSDNMTTLGVEDGVERYIHAFVDHIRDSITIKFNYGQPDSGYNVSLSVSTSTIEGNGSTECEVVATTSGGSPVDAGTSVYWDIDENYGSFYRNESVIGTKSVIDEEQTSRDIKTVNVTYPISSITSVTLRGGGTAYAVESFDGTTITLTDVLPFNDTVVWVTYVGAGVSSNILRGSDSVSIEAQTDIHATVDSVRDTQTITFRPASFTENVRMRLKSDGSSIVGTSTLSYEAVVSELDGSPVSNGTSVAWTIDNDTYGSFQRSSTTTTTKSISNEEVVASSRHTINVDYPIVSVSSVVLRGGSGEYYTSGSSFSGNSITLATPLPFNNSAVWVTYVGGGVSTNVLEGAGFTINVEGGIDLETHAISDGVRATISVNFSGSDAAAHASLSLSADPTSLDADDESESELEVVVTDEDSGPVVNGTEIIWTIDDSYGTFNSSTTVTRNKAIANEEQEASNSTTVSTDYPIRNVASVLINGTNYYTAGSSFVGSTITVATAFPFNDSLVQINYTGSGVSTNILTAGDEYPVDTYIHAYSLGIRDSIQIDFKEPDISDTDDAFVTIIVKDRNTGNVIVGAGVTVDGVGRGATDSSGRLSLGITTAGTHTVVVTADGYDTSSEDFLQNDSFVV